MQNVHLGLRFFGSEKQNSRIYNVNGTGFTHDNHRTNRYIRPWRSAPLILKGRGRLLRIEKKEIADGHPVDEYNNEVLCRLTPRNAG